ncbi:glycosyltransferase family 39 protein [Agromyces sp. Leaf222]|uniref:ArnT family glycosyltransferase n=1 Tax=Agromyces sp. Leaf222 TaxID=1735688 RepID=UPI0006F67FC0|nr:glycosyltransferase family 39 protein [Agromyces sp. Leaf222]KQM83937.1 hypothetical protein ASE68_12600 [Agromyces sp. Leaf222]
MSATTLPRQAEAAQRDDVATDERGGATRSESRRVARARSSRRTAILVAIALAVVAALLRLIDITTSYDIFIDEATYAAIARDTTLLVGPTLHGLSFVLHPPIALLLLAGPAQFLGSHDVAALIVGLRPVAAVFGSLTVAVLYLALRRAGLRKAALAAAALVALDPFIISFDSRVMLEAFAQLFAVLTVAAAIRTATADPRTRWRWAVVTAVAGAATFGTKETFGLVILATLVLVACTAPRGERRGPMIAVAGTFFGYALVNLAMISWAGVGVWWHMRTDGLSRLLGTQQSTGFKAEGVQVSLWDRLLPNGVELAATYTILTIGGLCAISLLWGLLRRRAWAVDLAPGAAAAVRIVAIWAVCACGYVAYAVVFGSLEEQMFYIAVVPCAAALSIRVFVIGRRVLRRAGIVGVVAILCLQGVAWVQVHTVSDDVYAQLLERVADVAPAGSTLAVTEETGQFVISGYELGQWATAPELIEHDVDFVLLSDRLVEHGYGLADQEFADAVREHGELVLSVQGRENDLQLYDVRDWTHPAGSDIATTGDGS